MKRYLAKLLAFLAIQAVMAAVLWREIPAQSDHYLATLADKHHALLHQPGPRLLILGGSSTAFGISSPEFKQRLPLTPINMGMHAAAGLEFMLRHAECHVKPGDVVLVCPEFQLLVDSQMNPTPEIAKEMLREWPNAADYLPRETLALCDSNEVPPTWKEWFDRSAIQDVQQRLRLGRSGLVKKYAPSWALRFRYLRSGFNEFGDMVGHYDREPRPFHVPAPAMVQADSVRAVAARLNRFAETCRGQQAQVFFAYAPLLAGSQANADQLHRVLVEELRIPILHHPAECELAAEQFFDTALHPTKDGAQQRSRFLADCLEKQLRLAQETGGLPIRR